MIVSIVAFLAVVGGVFAYALRGGSTTAVPTQTQSDNPADTAQVTSNAPTTKYKDGTYSATGDYMSPGGPDSLSVTLTLKNGLVTDVNAEKGANDPRSSRYQDRFLSGYKAYVIGKSIDTLHLDSVSGSSLTPEGFNDAVNKIKTQALQA